MDEIYAIGEVYPPREMVFRVFEMDIKEIRIWLVGQNCYHNPGEAHWLSFSVPTGEKIPPFLNNIYKELQIEFPERGYKFTNGNLE